jgi:dihydroorotase
MPTLLSKFLALGMPLKDVMLRATWNSAQVIHRTELGHLTAGAGADIAVWNILRGQFGYGDAYGGRIAATERLVCEMTLLNGEIVWDWNARAAQDYRKLGPSYGIRPGIDRIIPPK